MTGPFKILLALHTPVVLQAVPPRLDGLLHEACCRLHGDWACNHDLPLDRDPVLAGYRASQITFVSTPEYPLAASDFALVAQPEALDRHLVTEPPKKIKENGGPYSGRLSRYEGLICPYLAFYGDGDGEACADLLELLDGVGRLHMMGGGSFTVVGVEPDDSAGWRLRSWPKKWACDAPAKANIPAIESLTVGGEDEPIVRPRRIMREVMR